MKSSCTKPSLRSREFRASSHLSIHLDRADSVLPYVIGLHLILPAMAVHVVRFGVLACAAALFGT